MTEIVEHKGRFPAGKSGNPGGRPKGSKNQITLMKLMAEQAVRDDNAEGILAVCRLVIEQALNGEKASQALVWKSVVSQGTADMAEAKDKVEIKIGTFTPEEKPIEAEVTIIPNEDES